MLEVPFPPSISYRRGSCLQGSSFHRVIPGFMCQGGDFTVRLLGPSSSAPPPGETGPHFPPPLPKSERVSHSAKACGVCVFVCMCVYVFGQRGNGTGGESIYGEKFRDENFTLKVKQHGCSPSASFVCP